MKRYVYAPYLGFGAALGFTWRPPQAREAHSQSPSFATGATPTQTQWTTLAEQMIAAIRTTDKVHSLIFGESLTRDTRVPCTLDRRLASPSLVNAIADLSGVN